MGALANAASLMGNPEWRTWIVAASAFVAAEVYQEDPVTLKHDVRLRLALDVLTVPEMVAGRMLTLVSTTQVVAEAGGTPTPAHEPLVLARVRQVWTAVAETTYPTDPPT